MEFPSFDDFRATLTEEKCIELMQDIHSVNRIEIKGLTQENISAFISHLSMQIIAASTVANLRYLEAYHEWLSQELAHQS